MKKLVSLALVLALALTLAACGASDQELLIGKWRTEIDITESANEGLKQGIAETDPTMVQYFEITSFKVQMVFTFREDGSYSMALDTSTLPDEFDKIKADMKDGFYAYMKDLIAQNGLDISVDELMEAQGTTVDAMIDEAFPDSMLHDLADQMTREMSTSGTYEAEKGIMTLVINGEESLETYTLEGDVLTLTTKVSDPDTAAMYPMVFHKQG